MFNPINEVQRQYMFAVQPVQFFEAKKPKPAEGNLFNFISKTKTSGNNPFHPDVSNSEKGNHLDILG